jgi:hypothetical protein
MLHEVPNQEISQQNEAQHFNAIWTLQEVIVDEQRSSWRNSDAIKASQRGRLRKRSNGARGELLQATAHAKVDSPNQKNARK